MNLKSIRFMFLVLILSFFAVIVRAEDPMQTIEQKAEEVRKSVQEIVTEANRNAGSTWPDPTLEKAISRLEAALHSLDYALTVSPRLPPCEKVPPLQLDDAEAALRGIINDNVPDDPALQKEIHDTIQRKLFLQRVNTTSKNILKIKLNASIFSLGLNLIPLPGKNAWDFVNLMDNILSRLNMNPTDPTTGRAGIRFTGVGDYRQFLNEPQNKEEFNRFATEQAQKMGYVHRMGGTADLKKMTEYDVALWANVFTLKKTQEEITQLDQKLQRLKGAPEKSKEIRAKAKRRYFEDLVYRFERTHQTYAWIANPSSIERMEGAIRVTVLDDAGGALLHPTVDLDPATITGYEDAPNVILFDGLAKGTYNLKASKGGYLSESASVQLDDCKKVAHAFKLKKKPIIKVVDIKDVEGNLIDDVRVDVTDLSAGTSAGNKTYNRVALLFMVDKEGAFTVTATDNGNLYETDSQSVTAEAGKETEVHLVMKSKTGPELVFEINDSLSGKRIDPAPGSTDPGVRLDPEEKQPNPSLKPYAGNGEVIFTQIRAGRYKYLASLCGWSTVTGTITISADEMKLKRIVRQVSMKPSTLRSFTGNVVEVGTTEHISGYKVSLIGLGPRIGYRYDTMEGKHPDPSVVGFHFGAFYIPGPIYSGRYELQITTACYEPIRADSWWNFCLEDSSYTPQNFNLKPTSEFDTARTQVRSLLKKMNEEREKARQAADAVAAARRKAQGLADLANELTRELLALKQQYPTLEKLCTDMLADLKSIQTDLATLEAAGTDIVALRETAKYMAGLACETSRKAQTHTDPVKATNLAINSKKFADQTKKKAEEAETAAKNAQQAYQSLIQKLQKIQKLAAHSEAFRKAFALLKPRLADLRAQANTITQTPTELANATAALTQAQAHLTTIRGLLLPCDKTNSAKSLLAQADTALRGTATEAKRADDENQLLQQFLTTAGPAAKQANSLGTELERWSAACDPYKDFQDSSADAKATADTIDLYAQAAQESAREALDCANTAARFGNSTQTIQNIQKLMEACDYQMALASANQLWSDDPQNPWLTQNLGRLQQMATSLTTVESQIQQSFQEGEASMNACDPENAKIYYDDAIANYQDNLNNPKCKIYATVQSATQKSHQAAQVDADIRSVISAINPLHQWMASTCPPDFTGINTAIQSAERVVNQAQNKWRHCDFNDSVMAIADARSYVDDCRDQSTLIAQGVEDLPEDDSEDYPEDDPELPGIEEIPEDTETSGNQPQGPGDTNVGTTPTFTGKWKSSYGTLTLSQGGTSVSGSSDYYGTQISGTIKEDGKLYFNWSDSNNKKGVGVFLLSSDGQYFTGTWNYLLSDGKTLGNGGTWSGQRIQ